MGRSQTIRQSDAGYLLRLAGEATELRDLTARRRHIMHGMRQLIGGHSGLLFQMFKFDPIGGFAAPDTLQFEGLDTHAQKLQRDYLVKGAFMDPNAPTMIGIGHRVITHRRGHLLDDKTWYRTDHFQNIRRPCGIDDQLYSKVHLPDGSMIGLGIQRALDDKKFTDRDCRLVDLFHEQMASLYLPRPTDIASTVPGAIDYAAELPPRLRPVLNCLLAGDSTKQVALKLGLSVHTVHEYIKMMHRKLNVSSRGELLALFVNRSASTSHPA